MAKQFPQWDALVADLSNTLNAHAENQQAIAWARLDKKLPDLVAKHSKASAEDPIGIKSFEFIPAELGAKTMRAFQEEARTAVERAKAAATEFGNSVSEKSMDLKKKYQSASAENLRVQMQEEVRELERHSTKLGELARPDASPDMALVVRKAINDEDRFNKLKDNKHELAREFEKEWDNRVATQETSALNFVRNSRGEQQFRSEIDAFWKNIGEFGTIQKSAVSAKASVDELLARLKKAVECGERQVGTLDQMKKDKQKHLKEKREEFKSLLTRLLTLAVELEDADIEVGVVELQLSKTIEDLECERTRATLTSAAADSAMEAICLQETTAAICDGAARAQVQEALPELIRMMMPFFHARARRQQVALELCTLTRQKKDERILSLEAKVQEREVADSSGGSGLQASMKRASKQTELREKRDELEEQRELRQEIEEHRNALQDQYEALLSLREHGATFDEDALKKEASQLAKNALKDFNVDADDDQATGAASSAATGGISSAPSSQLACQGKMQDMWKRMQELEKKVEARYRQRLAEQQSGSSEDFNDDDDQAIGAASSAATGGISSAPSLQLALQGEMHEMQDMLNRMQELEKKVEARDRQRLAEQQSSSSEAGTIDQYDVIDPTDS